MKKYITLAALLAAGTACANAATFSNDPSTYNYNSKAHGFYFSLSGMTSDAENVDGKQFVLNSLTVTKGGNAAGANVTYGLLLLGETDNKILGYTNTLENVNNNQSDPLTFTFESTEEASLTIDYSSTYRCLTVSSTVIDSVVSALQNDVVTSLMYSAGNGDVSSSILDGVCTISMGLTAPAFRGYASTDQDDVPYTIITGANGTNYTGNGSYYVGNVATSITATVVPEPSAFGMLAGLGALALVASRRRRK